MKITRISQLYTTQGNPDDFARRYPDNRLGCVLVFARNVDRREAARALDTIRVFLDPESQGTNAIRGFNEEIGWPVWYIP
jgi:hypothetical protein